MGTFLGHLVPGSLFTILAIIWTISLLRYYFRNVRRQKSGLDEDLYFDAKKFGKPIVSIIIVVSTPFAMLGEYLTAFEGGGPQMSPDNVQHITMYLFFFILSIINLLEVYFCSPLPSIVDQLYGFAFGVETLLLYFHVHGKSPFEQHLHKLWTLAAFLSSLCSFLGGYSRKDVIVQLGKPLFVLLQGTWIIQIAFLLYSPSLALHVHNKPAHHHHIVESVNQTHIEHTTHDHMHLDDHDLKTAHDSMVVTAYFCWHFAFSIIVIYVLSFVCKKKYFQPSKLLNHKYQRLLEETAVHDETLVN